MARSRELRHPTGIPITTPLLVPSFSSLALPSIEDMQRALKISSEWLTDSMLVSAYDLRWGHVPRPADMECMPEFTIVDSGGYELSVDHDFSTIKPNHATPNSWTRTDLRAELKRWPSRFAAAFVSFDSPTRRSDFATQAARAKKDTDAFPDQMHTFLIKPESKGEGFVHSALEAAFAQIDLLAPFSFIGLTEKELGGSLLSRMQWIAKLRVAMDEAKQPAPIHIFGALDPVTTCLYFLAGAEVFDGLTWLRFAYRRGACVYRANYGALAVGVDRNDSFVEAKNLFDNITTLAELEMAMRRVAHDQCFDHFPHHGEHFRLCFDSLRTRFRGDN